MLLASVMCSERQIVKMSLAATFRTDWRRRVRCCGSPTSQ